MLCVAAPSDALSFIALIDRQQSVVLSQRQKYLINPSDEFSTKSITVWLVADISLSEGRGLVLNALDHLEQSANMRIGLIPILPQSSDPLVPQTVMTVLETHSESKAFGFIKVFLADSSEAQAARKSKEAMLEFAKSVKVKNVTEYGKTDRQTCPANR